MTPIRYTFLLLLLCLFAGARTAQAQCSANAVTTNVTCFGLSNGSIDLTASNGTAPYTYLWSNSATTEDIVALAAGTYTVTVTDALACTTTRSAAVTQPPVLSVSVPNLTLTCVTPSGSMVANVTGGTAPYTYLWSNGTTTAFLQANQPGTYTVIVEDANNCLANTSANLSADFTEPSACVFPAQLLTCVLTQIVLDGSCSSIGTNFFYVWEGPGINSGNFDNLTPTISIPGTYTLLVTNTANGCTSTANVVVAQDNIGPQMANAGPDLTLPCGGGTVTLVGSHPGGPNFTYGWTTLGGNFVSGATTLNPVVNEPGTYMLMVVNLISGCTSTDVMQVTNNPSALCSTIEGRIIQDTIANCLSDAGEPPLAGWILKAVGVLGTYYAVSDINGDYQLSVLTGDTYTISAVPPSNLWAPCSPIAAIVVVNPNETLPAADLLFQKVAGCSLLSVDISSGNLRRCFPDNFFSVNYCNNGTESAQDAFVLITLDPLFSDVGSNYPFTIQGNGVLNFQFVDIEAGQCGTFYFSAKLSCDAVLGQTHCTEAHIYPDSTCIPSNILWSGASIRLSSECQTDSIRFTIENIGNGNMPNVVDYIVVEDQVMLMSAPIQLDAGESVTVSVPANGSTWRLEVDQVPFHPGQSAPAVSVEGCTTSPTFSTGFVAQFPTDDADEFIDIDCRANTGSYDPNDKQGYPLGYGAQHYVRPGTPLEYQIRFQNTGNDTAFTVRVVDTLSAWLDPATIRPGASSHPYSWDLSGAGVLTFLFENILLADSNVNEPASHGFFKFTINHREDAPLETVIENTAEIYFDYNEAIVTNTTFHRLGENFVTVGLWQPQQPGYEVLVSPNPFSDAAILEVKGLSINSSIHLQVFDLQGKLHLEMDSEGAVLQLKKGRLAAGAYFFKIDQAGKNLGTGKLVIQD